MDTYVTHRWWIRILYAFLMSRTEVLPIFKIPLANSQKPYSFLGSGGTKLEVRGGTG
jgi:hypothetical protein